METIKEIFNNKLFRIPDYQRGYSWEEDHLDDFYNDLIHLQDDRIHYTGMISVEEVDTQEYSKWIDDIWIIDGRKDKPYFIVDGQQRITTIIILIWVILSLTGDDDELGFESKETIIKKYIYSANPKQGHKSYIFGYHKDNPSYEFLKREVFEQNDITTEIDLEETAYTNNLLNAKNYFINKVRKMTHQDRDLLFSKVTNQLKFDFKVIEKELDIFIVFETMNNRGKPLSNLEKLKNRLIYLSTLLKDDDEKRNVLRDQINEHWKVVYKYLGLNKDKKLDDDSFLQNHWIMYWRYERREPEFYANDIFNRVFTTINVLKNEIGFEEIERYIMSMSEGIKKWFIMYNPSHPHALELTDSPELLFWLKKQNRLGYKAFAPLLMASMIVENNMAILTQLVKAIESYVFLIFNVSFRRSNTGTYHFNTKANEVFNQSLSIQNLIKDINYWVFGDDEYHGYFDSNNFINFLSEYFSRDSSNGYLDWKYLRYFLYEYEIFLNGSESDLSWSDSKILTPIYPKSPLRTCWKVGFENYKEIQKFKLYGTLGNFVLSSKPKEIEPNACFEDIKIALANSSFNEKEISKYNTWTANEILDRGLNMLEFMETRWKISLGDIDYKKKLLFLDFVEDDRPRFIPPF